MVKNIINFVVLSSIVDESKIECCWENGVGCTMPLYGLEHYLTLVKKYGIPYKIVVTDKNGDFTLKKDN